MTNKEKLMSLSSKEFTELIYWSDGRIHRYFWNSTQSDMAFEEWLDEEYDVYFWETFLKGE